MRRSSRNSLGLFILLGLVGCAQGREEPPEREALLAQIQPSVVRISYGDTDGQGTGFIIDGEPGVCTVATAAHVVKPSNLIAISTHDSDIVNQGPIPAKAVQMSEDLDLAIVTFNMPGGGCPYASLPLGDSNTLKQLDLIYLFGFPDGGEKALSQQQAAVGQISAVNLGNPEGYDIAYTNNSVAGMGGGPLVNQWGEVMGVHGREEAEFRLAIPIAKLQGQLPTLVAQLPDMAAGSAKALYEQGTTKLNEKKYQEALPYFERSFAPLRQTRQRPPSSA